MIHSACVSLCLMLAAANNKLRKLGHKLTHSPTPSKFYLLLSAGRVEWPNPIRYYRPYVQPSEPQNNPVSASVARWFFRVTHLITSLIHLLFAQAVIFFGQTKLYSLNFNGRQRQSQKYAKGATQLSITERTTSRIWYSFVVCLFLLKPKSREVLIGVYSTKEINCGI